MKWNHIEERRNFYRKRAVRRRMVAYVGILAVAMFCACVRIADAAPAKPPAWAQTSVNRLVGHRVTGLSWRCGRAVATTCVASNGRGLAVEFVGRRIVAAVA